MSLSINVEKNEKIKINTIHFEGNSFLTSSHTGKMERNLEQAKAMIDMLEMLHIKTKGNITSCK